MRALWKIWVVEGRSSSWSRKAELISMLDPLAYRCRTAFVVTHLNYVCWLDINGGLCMLRFCSWVVAAGEKNWKARRGRCCKFKLTLTSHHQTARAIVHMEADQQVFVEPFALLQRPHDLRLLMSPCAYLIGQRESICCVALGMQNKSTMRNTHHYCCKAHGR